MLYSFSKEEAIAYGVEEAIFLHNLRHWIWQNRANKKHCYPIPDEYDGIAGQVRHWTYNSVEAYSELFAFWTKKQIRRVIESLLEQRIIIKGCFGDNKYDRTNWYAFADENFMLGVQKKEMHLPKWANEEAHLGKCITDSNTNSKQKDSQNEFESLKTNDTSGNNETKTEEENISLLENKSQQEVKKERKSSAKKKEKEESTPTLLQTALKQIFFTWYKKRHGFEYDNTAASTVKRDNAIMKNFVADGGKLKAKFVARYSREGTDQELQKFFSNILENEDSKWINHIDIPKLYSQFEEIYMKAKANADMKNGKTPTITQQVPSTPKSKSYQELIEERKMLAEKMKNEKLNK